MHPAVIILTKTGRVLGSGPTLGSPIVAGLSQIQISLVLIHVCPGMSRVNVT
jgi:hypothetical protein